MAILGENRSDRAVIDDLLAYLKGEYQKGLPLRMTVRVPSATGYQLRDQVVSRLEVASALRQLPLRQRRVVELLFEQDRPAEEVARVLGISERTVYEDRGKALAAMASVIYQEAA